MNHTYRIEIFDIHGKCKRGYKKGDTFHFHGLDTPNKFCGGAYTVLYPILLTLQSGGKFTFEKNPTQRTAISCPEGGTVLFNVTLCTIPSGTDII